MCARVWDGSSSQIDVNKFYVFLMSQSIMSSGQFDKNCFLQKNLVCLCLYAKVKLCKNLSSISQAANGGTKFQAEISSFFQPKVTHVQANRPYKGSNSQPSQVLGHGLVTFSVSIIFTYFLEPLSVRCVYFIMFQYSVSKHQ